ncbi:MAG: hypothetical protein HFJ02_05450 [Bacilli bacterium]|nr:hypothetical protein [Bacilli bacterium]
MRQIKETKNISTIVLEEGDILKICKNGSKHKTRIVCMTHTILFDDITYNELTNIKEEKKANYHINKFMRNLKK